MKQRDIVSLLRREFGHHEVTVFSKAVKDQKGVLDTLNSVLYKSAWIEIKIDKDKLSPMQEKFMGRHCLNSYCIHYKSNQDEFLLMKFNIILNCLVLVYRSKNFLDITNYITEEYSS